MSLPTKQIAHDPYEKPDRYEGSYRNPDYLDKMKEAWMSQSQRSRWSKTGALVFALVCLFYWFSPSGVEVHNGSEQAHFDAGYYKNLDR